MATKKSTPAKKPSDNGYAIGGQNKATSASRVRASNKKVETFAAKYLDKDSPKNTYSRKETYKAYDDAYKNVFGGKPTGKIKKK